jgi:hypothetical protein
VIQHKKNTAYYLSFPAIDSATPALYASGVTIAIDAYSKDGVGVWTALAIADTITEIGTSGTYELTLSAAELNHDKVMVKVSGTGMADDAFQFDLSAKVVTDLNDVAATDVVSAGAITTLGGAVVNVDSVDSVTALATDSVNADAIAADAVTEIQSGLSTFNSSTTPVEIIATGGTAGGKAADELVDDIYDEPKADHKVGGTFGKVFNLFADAAGIESTVNDLSPTTTSIRTTLPNGVKYLGMNVVFLDGTVNHGNARVVQDSSWDGTYTTLTFDSLEPFDLVPVNGENFLLSTLAGHTHTLTEMISAIDANSTKLDVAVSTRSTFDSTADSVTLNVAQPSITFQPITITASDGFANIDLAGSGTADAIALTRAGAGGLMDAGYSTEFQAEVLASLSGGVTLTAGERLAIAESVLAADMGAGRTVEQALAVLRNRVAVVGGIFTVYDTDDVTPLFTAAVSTAAGDPVSEIDPV